MKTRTNWTALGLRGSLLSTVPMVLMIAGAAQAQSATAPSAAQPANGQLTEVIVTAQKRSENLQKAPLAITAVTSQDLRAEHITSPTDLTNIIPDTLVNSGGSAGDNGASKAVFSIRGLGASGTNPEGSPGVAIHEDGHYFQSGLAANEFFDLQRIEVSPGPQGTLYGRSASAGAVNVITNKPVGEFHADAEIEGGNYGEFRVFGMLNAPVTDTLFLRVSGQYQKHDGYFSNGFDDLDSGAIRAQLLWTPSDKLSVRFVAQYLENGGLGSTPAEIGATSTALGLTGDVYHHSVAQNTYTEGAIVPSGDQIDVQKTDFFGEITYNFGPAILTVSPTFERYINNINNGPIGGPYSTFSTNGPAQQDGLEVRLNDPGGGRLKWVVGANYFDASLRAFISEHIVPNALAQAAAGPFHGVVVADAFDSIDLSYQSSYAFFGQATYSVTDRLRLTAGLRQNWDNASYRGHLGTTSLTIGASPNLNGPPVVTPELFSSVSFEQTTWKLAVDYDLTPRSLLYATVGTGYKPGGLNEGGPASSNVPASPLAPSQVYQPETVMHYEIGSKNRFFGNRLQVNDAAYFDDYSNYQNANNQIVNPLAIGAIGGVETNAGKARVYGNEFSTIFQLTSADRFTASVNYLYAKFSSYNVPAYLGSGFGVVPAQSYAGYSLPNAPRWSGTASYSHRFDLPGGDNITALAQTYLSSSYWSYFQEQPGTQQGSYTKTTLNLTYETAKRDISVSVFVKNLENNATLVAGAYTQPFTYVYVDAPRTYGITVSKHF